MKIVGMVVLDNGFEVPFTGVLYPARVPVKQIFQEILQETKEEMTKLYLELNKIYLVQVPNTIEDLYNKASIDMRNKALKPPVSPIRTSILSLYIGCIKQQLKIKQIYFECDNQKESLTAPIVKYFDANLKKADKHISQIRS